MKWRKWAEGAHTVSIRITINNGDDAFIKVHPADLYELMALMGDDIRKIEEAEQTLKHRYIEEGYEDDKSFARDLHYARLFVWSITLLVLGALLEDGGFDAAAPGMLGEAINSSLTGNGRLWKRLTPTRKPSNTGELSDVNMRAKLVALHLQIDDNPRRVSDLYDAASALTGLERPQIRKMVENGRGGRQKDSTFRFLCTHWQAVYREMDLSAHDMGDLLRL